MTTNIYSALHEGNLLDAFRMLKTKIDSLGDWQLEQDLDAASHTYTTMLEYLYRGVDDPDGTKIREDIIRQTYALNDRANLAIRMRKSPNDKYCQTLRQCSSEQFSLTEIQVALETIATQQLKIEKDDTLRPSKAEHDIRELAEQHDGLMARLFNHTWTSPLWTGSDYTLYSDFITRQDIPSADRALVVSAVMLATYELFDPQKLMLLMDAYLDTEVDVSQRGLVGLLLLFIRYDKRMSHYTNITSRFALYAENQQFVADCYQAFIALQYSKMSDTVSAKMMGDILPAILKSQKFKKSSVIELDAELTKNGENPEWLPDTKADSRAEEKIRQMSEMQMEGADVYLTSFRHLKSFSFFGQIHHWLTIFSFNYPDILSIKSSLKPEVMHVVSMLLGTAPFCDSDKFSFMSMLSSLPQTGHDVLAGQIRSQLEEAGGEDLFDLKKGRTRSAKGALRSYIADLYRLFKVYPYHTQLFDPFSKQIYNFSPLNTSSLAPLLEHKGQVMNLAEFMMRKGLYSDAYRLFMYLQPVEREADADLWQKIGFCLQKMGNVDEALDIYLKAHRLQPGSGWTIGHVAQTAFEARQYDKALEFIDLILDSDPDNVKWLGRKAECLFATDHYDECLPTLYKLAYIDENSERTKEMLAWGLMMTGAFDKAEKLYSELHQQQSTVKSHINMGHIHLVADHFALAIQHYSAAYRASKDEQEFKQQYWESGTYLDRLGVSHVRLQMIYDAVVSGVQ